MKVDVAPRSNGTVYIRIEWPERRDMILSRALHHLERHDDVRSIDKSSFAVEIKQQTEGSPAYNVQKWTIEVRGEVELQPKSQEMQR